MIETKKPQNWETSNAINKNTEDFNEKQLSKNLVLEPGYANSNEKKVLMKYEMKLSHFAAFTTICISTYFMFICLILELLW